MPADSSLGNFLTHNDPWAQDYGNKRFAHWETTGGLALFVVHMEGHMNNTMRRFKLSRDRNQGAAMVHRDAMLDRVAPAQIWARSASATRSRHLPVFASARVPTRSASKQRVWR